MQGFTPGQPASGARVQVSGGGGQQPSWRRDGRELYYVGPEGKLMAVEVKTQGSAFQYGQLSVLFSFGLDYHQGQVRLYDVSADGRRFLLSEPIEAQTEGQPLTLITNWLEGARK